MKINKVILKNYRVHAEKEVEFDRGINLLLGKNGAGKSSILEAIGLAMFDTGCRSNQADAIKYGEKSATITVEFEGIDNNEYIVERKIGSGTNFKLYVKGDKHARIKGKEDVLKKIKELAGIETNEKNIFQNVITAYQNKIVGIFGDTSAKREATFNQIFDTAVYRRIFDKFSKEAKTRYETGISAKNEIIEGLEVKIVDSGEIRDKIKERKMQKKDSTEKLAKIVSEIDDFEKQKKELDVVKANLETAESDIKHKKELLASQKSEEEKNQHHFEESKRAVKIIEDNKAHFETYEEQNSKLKEISSSITKLEKIEVKKNNLNEKRNKLETRKKTNITRLELTEKELVENNSKLQKNQESYQLLKSDYLKEKSELEPLKKIGIEHNKLYNDFSAKVKNIKDYYNNSSNYLAQINLLKKSAIDENEYLKGIEQLKTIDMIKFNTQKKEAEKLKNEITAYKYSLKENNKAEKELSTGICPILKEQCQNVTQNDSGTDYFVKRREEIQGALTSLEKEYIVFKNIDKDILECKNQISLKEKKIEENRKLTISIVELERDIEKNKNLTSTVKAEISELLIPFAEKIAVELKNSDYEKIGNSLNAKLLKLRDQYTTLNSACKNKKEYLDKIAIDIDELTKNIGTRNDLKSKLKEENSKIEEETKSVIVQIDLYENQIESLPSLKKERGKISELLEKLKKSHDLYVSSKQKAGEFEKLKKRAEELVEKIKTTSVEIEKLKEIALKYNDSFSDEKYKTLLKIITEKTTEKEKLIQTISSIETTLALLKKDLDNNTALEKEHKENRVKLKKLKNKLELTDIFRRNINDMGKHVAHRLMQRIEMSATKNYRQITGRSEEVQWRNEGKEAYIVYLAEGGEDERKRKFEVLSGGEQVAVALSIRAAMASFLTKADFAIFDEPTINLDSEKKIALAESLKEILKNLQQAIIVTHDEAFTEMAQKIIEI